MRLKWIKTVWEYDGEVTTWTKGREINTQLEELHNGFNKYFLHQILLTYLLTYLLTPWSRVLLEKLTGSAASQEIPAFLEHEGSSPYTQMPATCPYPEPTPSSPHNPLPLPEDSSYYYPPICVWVSPMVFNKYYVDKTGGGWNVLRPACRL